MEIRLDEVLRLVEPLSKPEASPHLFLPCEHSPEGAVWKTGVQKEAPPTADPAWSEPPCMGSHMARGQLDKIVAFLTWNILRA